MTDPTGPCLLSYKRERAAEAALIVDALRDHGIPAWQDVSDLRSQVTETALRRVLEDPQTSGAILLVTPEVEQSAAIRNLEVPGIFARVSRDDGFFAVPLAAGGLGYGDIGRVLGPGTGLTEMSGFNILKSDGDLIDAAFAAEVARRVLRERLLAFCGVTPAAAPVTFRVGTRPGLPKTAGFTLLADLGHRFGSRHATTGSWEGFILPAFRAVATELARSAPGREIRAGGYLPLPAAAALGSAFPSIGPVRASWMQEQAKFGLEPERWALDVPEANCGFVVEEGPLDMAGSDLALLVSATNDVVHGFTLSRAGLPLRTAVHIKPREPRPDRLLLDAATGRHLACLAIDALRRVAGERRIRGTVHLFLAVPAGVAFMIGQQLNTFGRVQTYEYDPGASPPYVAAAAFNPSA